MCGRVNTLLGSYQGPQVTMEPNCDTLLVLSLVILIDINGPGSCTV